MQGGDYRTRSLQRHNGCHFVSFVMYLSDAKFEGHRSNISSDILDLLFYFFKSCTSYQLWRHHIPNLHNTKRQYL